MGRIPITGIVSGEIYKKTKSVLCQSHKSFRCVNRFVPPNKKEKLCLYCRNFEESDTMFHVQHVQNNDYEQDKKGWERQEMLINNNQNNLMDSTLNENVPVTEKSDWEVVNKETKAVSAVVWTFLDKEFVDVKFNEDDEEKQVRFDVDQDKNRLLTNSEYAVRLIHGKFSTNKDFIVDDNGEFQSIPDAQTQEVGTGAQPETQN